MVLLNADFTKRNAELALLTVALVTGVVSKTGEW